MLVLHIAGRELRSFFTTSVGWLVTAGFLFLSGVFWWAMFSYYVQTSVDVVSNPYAMQQINVVDYLAAPFFQNMALIVVFVCPALAMRLFADETKNRTIELLLTSPVSTAEIVIGKFLGALGAMLIVLLGTAYVPISLFMWWGTPDWGSIVGGYLALILTASSVIAIGTLMSALVDSSLAALVLGFSASLGIWLLSFFSQGEPDSLFTKLSFPGHFDMMHGELKVSDLVYFLGITIFCLFASGMRVEGYRWR